MRRPFVKVCGITRAGDALGLAALGVDALGFILAEESPRRIAVEGAREIVRSLPESVATVGVVVAPGVETVRRWRERIGLTAIQAHGDEDPATCRAYGEPVLRAVRSEPGLDPGSLDVFLGMPLLLDGYAAGARGGTGRRADWSLARELRDRGHCIVLAGGLGPDNVREAVEAVGPAAVDLNSGVETAPGVKDLDRVRRTLEALGDLDPPAPEDRPW